MAQLQQLKRRRDFLRVAGRGRKAVSPGVLVQALARSDCEPARLGFTVTRKVGNAVVRNRTRRRLREAISIVLRDHPLLGVDLVLIGRAATISRPFAALQDDLRQALAKVNLG